MEELKPEDLEALVRELEGESSAQESPRPDIDQLLGVLQSGTVYSARRDAAEQLGEVGTSSPRIVRALVAAYESDSYATVSQAAARSLRAPVHQEYLREDPDLMEVVEKALEQRPGSERQGPRPDMSSERAELEAQLESIAKSDSGLAGLFAAVAASALKSDHSDESQALSYQLGAAFGALYARIRRSRTKRDESVSSSEPKELDTEASREASRGHGGDLAQDCPTCGAWNEPGNEICDECGSALDGAAA